MPLVKVDIPAGIYNHGNELDSKGRWLDSSLVRWTNNSAQPVGGWVYFADVEQLITNGDFTDATGWSVTLASGTGTISQNTTDGEITFDINGTGEVFRDASASLEAGTTYFVEITIESLVSGTILPKLDGVSGTAITTADVDGITKITQEITTGNPLTSASNSGFSVYTDAEGVISKFRVYKKDRKYRASHTWVNNSNNPYFASASYNRIAIIDGNGSSYDITPSPVPSGTAEAAQNTGYGGSTYGSGNYGVEREEDFTIAEATVWTLANWGEDLLAVSNSDGQIYELDMSAWSLAPTTTPMTKVSANALVVDIADGTTANPTEVPTSNYGLVVTAERFVFALRAGGNPRKVQWCDRENLYEWQPSVINEAGDIELQTSGSLVAGVSVRGRTLLLTTTDCWTATYQGPPTVFGFQKIGDSCGLVGKNMLASVGPSAFWMGKNNFFFYDGTQARVLPCEVHDKVFTELNRSKVSHGWCVANQKFNEVWWFYPANGADECNKYVAYDYRENHWLIGDLTRSTGVDSGPFQEPWWVANSAAYRHETGFGHESASVFLESGPIDFADGDTVARVTEVIPEEDTQGEVSLKFKTKFYPNDTETTHGPYNPANPMSVRFTGRQVKLRIDGGEGNNWRFGDLRMRASGGGRR
jgi:hypothetical protein